MNITKTVETRKVSEIRLVAVSNVAAVGTDLLMSGEGNIKVTKLAKGGYSVRALGDNATYLNGGYYSNYGTRTRYVSALAKLRVDGEMVYIMNLFII